MIDAFVALTAAIITTRRLILEASTRYHSDAPAREDEAMNVEQTCRRGEVHAGTL